ncbi:alpha/beta hydrolase family protein [Thalassotalea aquiviva]|uniref:alpha/beta hydrolase family protein n=1 Tax=Thalassotalea aquiviva TaxID=3242415 RepID=UPI00352A8384
MFKKILCFLSLLLVSGVSLAFVPQQIPIEHFNKMPMVEQPTISPDGKHIAAVINQGEFTQVAIFPFEDKSKMEVILQLGAEKYRIDDLQWANDNRVLVSISSPLYLEQISRRVRSTHLYSSDIKGKNVFELRSRNRKQSQLDAYRSSPRLLSLLHSDPDHILVTQSDKRDNFYSSIFKVNINTGDFEKYVVNNKRFVSWGVNPDGDVLLGIAVDEDRNVDTKYIYTRKDPQSDWQLIRSFEPYQDAIFNPVMYEPSSNSVVVISDYKLQKDALWRYHIESEKFDLIAEAPGTLDITAAIVRLKDNKRKLVGYSYNDNFIKRKYFAQSSNNLDLQLSGLFSKNGLQSSLFDGDKSNNRFLLYAISDSSPGKFFTYDHNKKKVSLWYPQFPDLEQATLASVLPFEFMARDEMMLYGYLTLPNNVEKPPVVVFPHGGPFARDSQYFDPFVQLFANRGYAVLQVNYRGSTGYGGDYLTAGYYQWGKKMQTDLIDALKWLESTELANTSNACIVGASYGGYAALAAGYKTPELFKCIVSIAGVADMNKIVQSLKVKGFKNYVENAITSNEDELEQLSPVNFAHQFKAPVLLIHGKSDTRVSYRESEAMYEALKEANKSVEMELFQFGTHNLDGAVNRRDAMKRIDVFLQQHLKPETALAQVQ